MLRKSKGGLVFCVLGWTERESGGVERLRLRDRLGSSAGAGADLLLREVLSFESGRLSLDERGVVCDLSFLRFRSSTDVDKEREVVFLGRAGIWGGSRAFSLGRDFAWTSGFSLIGDFGLALVNSSSRTNDSLTAGRSLDIELSFSTVFSLATDFSLVILLSSSKGFSDSCCGAGDADRVLAASVLNFSLSSLSCLRNSRRSARRSSRSRVGLYFVLGLR